jgi:hypothetical protein
MRIILKFVGWFQCRIPTDPDSPDEPRGVSGYIQAVAGEPDLDQIIRLQPKGTIHRSYCPQIGVKIVNVYLDGNSIENHDLIGGSLNFLDNPKFEGRNGILAEDGTEGIFPMHIQIKQNNFLLQRIHEDNMSPSLLGFGDLKKFQDLRSSGGIRCPNEISEATGIFDLVKLWEERTNLLNADIIKETDEIKVAALKSRIRILKNTNLDRFFTMKMPYFIHLNGRHLYSDPDNYFPNKPIVKTLSFGREISVPWILEFWCGGWDADAQSAFMSGFLNISLEDR